MCTAGQTASEKRAARRDEIEYGKGAEEKRGRGEE